MKMTRHLGVLLLFFTLGCFANGISRVRRLAGGSDSEISQFPYMVRINWEDIHTCGGVIIAPNKVLSTASCLRKCLGNCKNDNYYHKLSITTGTNSLSKAGIVYRVKSVKLHDKFSQDTFAHDLGIATLDSDIQFSDNVKIIALPDEDIIPDSEAIVSGWGSKANKEPPTDILQNFTEIVTPSDKCNSYFIDSGLAVDDKDFCGIPVSGLGKAGLCNGDSGDPMIYNGKLIGIATWGRECGKPYPDVFANVYRHLDFIKSDLQ